MSGASFAQGDLVSVLTPLPIDRPYDYVAADALDSGDFVLVAVGPNEVVGVVWGPGVGDSDPAKLKPVLSRLDLPPMPEPTRRFLEKAADYTMTPLGQML
ncbi:MAG: primosomal protein N', partial [Pseudomonadota bacterium]